MSSSTSPRRVGALLLGALAGLAGCAVLVPSVHAADVSTAPAALPGALHPFALDARAARELSPAGVRRLRRHRVDALVLGRAVPRAQATRVRRLARDLAVFRPLPERDAARCRALETRSPGSRCAVMAASIPSALALARAGAADVAFVGLSRASELRRLRGARGRVVGLVKSGAVLRRGPWRAALRRARASRFVDVGVAPLGKPSRRAIARYLRLLRRSVPRRAGRMPSAPRALRARGLGGGSMRLTWRGRASRFGLYRDGVWLGDRTRTSARMRGLLCGAHLVEVDAVDRTGHRSAKAPLRLRRGPCDPSAGGPGRTGPRAPDERPATVFVATTGSDANPCTLARPCLSFDRAYRVAKPGEVVGVFAGAYSDTDIGVDPSKTSPDDVVFRPHQGGEVSSTSAVDVRGSHVEFRNMRFRGWYVKEGADDVTFRDVRVHGNIFITSASNVRVLGGEVERAGEYMTSDSQIKSLTAAHPPPANILIDGVFFHDMLRAPGSSDHIECLQVGSGVNVTIRNSRFLRCATHDIFIRSWGSGYPLRDWTLENNFFDDTTDGYYAVNIGAGVDGVPCESFLIRNNSAQQNLRSGCAPGGANGVRFYANIMPGMRSDQCGEAGAVYDYNVYRDGVACGPHDVVAGMGYANPDAFDLHLLPGAAAIGRGNPASFPPDDIDGNPRPAGGTPDAGADEAG